jgi:hypothetical protein
MSLAAEGSSTEAAFEAWQGLFLQRTGALERREAFRVRGACSRFFSA